MSQSWYHGGLLLQVHASTLVGAAALADIIAQVRNSSLNFTSNLHYQTPSCHR